jgi:dTDP-4-amino-4,6-dideoxygalactose transaminase
VKAIAHSCPSLGSAEVEAARATISSGFVGHGPRARELEALLAAATGKRFAFAVSSGFHALVLSLRILDLPAGSAVGIPVLTCGSLVAALRTAGYQPMLIDLREDLTLDPWAVRAVRSRLAAIVAPHAYGAPLDVGGFVALGLPWVEDCSTSPATLACGRQAGSGGTCAIFSFGSTKYLTSGTGGALVIDDEAMAERVADLLAADLPSPQGHWRHQEPIAFPGSMNDVAAALALVQWSRREEFAARRRTLALIYDRFLVGHPAFYPSSRQNGHSLYRYLLRTVDDAGPLARGLQAEGIDARTSVNPWLEKHAGVDLSAGPWPVAELWRGHLLSLPIYPQLSEADVTEVATRLLYFLSSHV